MSDTSSTRSQTPSSTPRSVTMSEPSALGPDPLERAQRKLKDAKVIESLRSQGVDPDDKATQSKLIQRWAKEYAARDKKSASKGSSTARDSTKNGLKSMERSEGAALRAARSGASSVDSEDDDDAALSLKDAAKTPWKTGRPSRASRSKQPTSDQATSEAPAQPSGKKDKSSRKPSQAETDARRKLISKRGTPRPDVFDEPPGPSEHAGVTREPFNLSHFLDDFSASGAESQKYDCPATVDGVRTTLPMTITHVGGDPMTRWAENYVPSGMGGTAHGNGYSEWHSAPVAHPPSWPSQLGPAAEIHRPAFEHWLNDYQYNRPRADPDPSRSEFMSYTPPNAPLPWQSPGVPPYGQSSSMAPGSPASWTGAPSNGGPLSTAGYAQYLNPTAPSHVSQQTYPPPRTLHPQSIFAPTQQTGAINPFTGAHEQTTPQYGLTGPYGYQTPSSPTSMYDPRPPPSHYGPTSGHEQPHPSQYAPTGMYGPPAPPSQMPYPGGSPSQPYSPFSQAPGSGSIGPGQYAPHFAPHFGQPPTYSGEPGPFGFPGAMQTGGPSTQPHGVAQLGRRLVNAD